MKHEKDVPGLPVPLLNQTAQQILTALKPLFTAEEYSEMLDEASQFVGNETLILIQKHLEEAATHVSCYLDAVNGELYPGVYGDLRGDTLPRNPYLVLEEDPFAKTINPPNQAQRAASLINSSLKFIVSMRNGTLKADFTPKSNKPLTMKCYRNLFGTTRIPDVSHDRFHQVTIKKYKHINDSRHVVFICNNQYYTLEVLTECKDTEATCKHQIWFNDAELAHIVQDVIDHALKIDRISSVNNGIGSITTQTYGMWKHSRLELLESNKDFMVAMDDALFVVALDTNSPVTDQDKTMVIAHGTVELLEGTNVQIGSCTSRWYDKLQLVVTDNAVAGVVWESSAMDSTAILRFISDIYTDLILKLARNINGAENTLFDESVQFVSGKDSDLKPVFRAVDFHITPELQHLVHLSETRLADLLNQHEYKTLTMKLDSHFLSKYKILPDSFLQIGFQIANYALYGKIAHTMEPITTRKFRDARTELIAVQNDLVSSLVKLFITSSDDAKKWKAYQACCAMHTNQYRDAMAGKGFERHFSALLQVLRKPRAVDNLNKINIGSGLEPIPSVEEMSRRQVPFLSNPLIEKLNSPELLISNCGNPALRLFGIPPAIDQGFGIGYIIHKDKVVVTVSSKYRQTERFLQTFKSVMGEIKNIIRTHSDVVLEIADSDARKLELKKLRIEKELKNVNMDLWLTRHPIDITVTSTPVSTLSEKIAKSKPTKAADSGNSSDDGKDDDFHFLGGYGYFDWGEVDIRSDEISRNESFLNSHTPSTVNSRHHSSVNLQSLSKHQLAPFPAQDLKSRLSMGDRIRDKLSPGLNASTSSLDEMVEPATPEEKPKGKIGRALDVSRS